MLSKIKNAITYLSIAMAIGLAAGMLLREFNPTFGKACVFGLLGIGTIFFLEGDEQHE